jgi:sugar transferase (PEP-CTERM system associated)
MKIGAQTIPGSTLLLVLLDVLSVVAGLLVAISLRFHDHRVIAEYLRGPNIFSRFGLVVLVCLVALYYSDLYSRPTSSSGVQALIGLLRALGAACVVLASVYFLDDSVSLGRGIAAISAPMALALMLVSRLVLSKLHLLIYNPSRVLVIGTAPTGISAVREVLSRPELNFKVEGFLDEKGENIGKSLVNPGIIGAVKDIESIASDRRIDQVILSLAERRGTMPTAQLLRLKFAGMVVEDAHSFIERITGRIAIEHLSPSSLILSPGFRKSAFLLSLKRVVDVAISLICLVLTLPLMAIVAAAIWLETGSPVLFRQERVGLNERTFEILKFRSMYQNAEQGGPVWASSNDKRITPLGRTLRKYRLDELPQLFNVLRGEMSLVGPRPERPHFCQLLERDIPLFTLRHATRPGITGWAQVRYQYGASLEEAGTKLEYDFFYIKHMSIFLDLAILFETAKVMFYGRGAH